MSITVQVRPSIGRAPRRWAALSAAVVLITGITAAADPKLDPAPPAARSDLFGDALPEGAVLRLGTVGFRVPNVAGVGFRPTGEMVAFAENLMLYVWPADGTPKPKVTAVTEKSQYGWRRALSPNARFAAAHVDRKIVVWDVSGDKAVEHLSREAGDVYTMSFSADGKWLAVNVTQPLENATVLLCDLAKKTWEELPFAGGYADALSFSPDGKSLAVVTGRGVSVIDTATRAERLRANIPKVRPRFAALSPDGKTLAVQPTNFIHGADLMVRFLPVTANEKVAELKAPPGPASWVGFSPDGKTILLGDRHGIREWDPLAGKLIREIAGPASYPAVYSADGRRLASHSGNAVLLWDVAKCRHIRRDLIEGGHTETIMGITVSPDGKLIATDALDGEVRMWAADSGRPLFRVRSSWGSNQRVAFLPDSKSFIVVADDYVTPVLRDAASGRELRRFVVPADAAKSETTQDLRLSVDGKTLTTASRPITVGEKSFSVRWDLATGRQLERIERAYDVSEFVFPTLTSPDGRWTVRSGTLSRVGAKESTTLVPQLETQGGVRASFSPDSRLVAVPRTPRIEPGGDRNQGSLVVYSIVAKAMVTELPTSRVMRHAISPNGREVAVVVAQEIALWDLYSGKTVRRFLIKHGNMMNGAIAFTPDGRRLITGQDDTTALVWDLTGTSRSGGAAPRLTADALDRLWEALAGNDAAKAHTAGWELTDRPEQTLALVGERLKPVRAADAAVVRRLVADLDAPAFADREAAAKSLRGLGDSAVPALRAALKAGLPAESAARVERLLTEASAPIPPADVLRALRAVAVLQRIETEDARKLLEQLASGLAEARLTREATQALKSFPQHSPPRN